MKLSFLEEHNEDNLSVEVKTPLWYATAENFGVRMIFKCVWKKYLMFTKADQKYSKNSNIVKYYCNFK